MFKKEEMIKIECRSDVLKFIRKRLDNMTPIDFYSKEEYELIRKEYMKMAEMVRDIDKLTYLKEKNKQYKNKHISKYFKER